MYAIVATGGKQYKVAVGDVVEVEKLSASPGESVNLPAVLIVDDGTVTHEAAALAEATVTAEIIGAAKGPKIKIHKFKNKTGYHKRMGHRQQLTHLRITAVESGTAAKAATAKAGTAKTSTAKTGTKAVAGADTDGE